MHKDEASAHQKATVRGIVDIQNEQVNGFKLGHVEFKNSGKNRELAYQIQSNETLLAFKIGFSYRYIYLDIPYSSNRKQHFSHHSSLSFFFIRL